MSWHGLASLALWTVILGPKVLEAARIISFELGMNEARVDRFHLAEATV